MQTVGISPKVLIPVVVQLLALLVNVLGVDLGVDELTQVATLVVTAVLGYLAKPGTVQRDATEVRA